MRLIGQIADAAAARDLADYLLAQGIRTHVDEAAGATELWAIDEDRVAEARQTFIEFQTNPADPRFRAARDEARRIREAQAQFRRSHQKNIVRVRQSWARGSAGVQPVTAILIGISILVALATRFGRWGDDGQPSRLVQSLSIASYRIDPVERRMTWNGLSEIRSGQVWRVLTPMFLHFGPMHLAFNMLTLYQIGSRVERRQGSRQFLLLVLIMAAVSALGQYAWGQIFGSGGPNFGGMSGVVFGLFGYVWSRGRREWIAEYQLPPGTVTWLVVFSVFCLLGLLGPIANGAHLAGAAAGLVLSLAHRAKLR